MIISPCHPSRSRYALFRALARFGIGCGPRPKGVDKDLLVGRNRQNPLEAWFLGFVFYLFYSLLQIALLDEIFELHPVISVLLLPPALIGAFLILVLLISVGWVVMKLAARGATLDPVHQPSRQATAQMVILLLISAVAVLVWRHWFSWIAASALLLAGVNAIAALFFPPGKQTEEELRFDLRF